MNPKINQADMDISGMHLGRFSCRSINKQQRIKTTTETTMSFRSMRRNIFTSLLI